MLLHPLKIDSSVASQRFDMFLSFGGVNKLKWLTAPRLPYRTRPDNLFKKEPGSIVEVPLSAFLHPYVGTTMRVFPTASRMARRLLHYESRLNRKPVVFDIHPNEFLNEHDGQFAQEKIARRSKNSVAYYLKDVVRRNLKLKNLGKAAFPLYEREIEFFKNRGYRFATLRDYVEQNSFEL